MSFTCRTLSKIDNLEGLLLSVLEMAKGVQSAKELFICIYKYVVFFILDSPFFLRPLPHPIPQRHYHSSVQVLLRDHTKNGGDLVVNRMVWLNMVQFNERVIK